jgi:hypothetical protein
VHLAGVGAGCYGRVQIEIEAGFGAIGSLYMGVRIPCDLRKEIDTDETSDRKKGNKKSFGD